MELRWPTLTETLVQCVLLALVVLVTWDFVIALGASACDAPQPVRTPNCYPWGMTEGPMGGAGWLYATKANYLRQQSVQIVVLTVGALAPFVTRDWRSGAAVAWLALPLGWFGAEWIARLI